MPLMRRYDETSASTGAWVLRGVDCGRDHVVATADAVGSSSLLRGRRRHFRGGSRRSAPSYWEGFAAECLFEHRERQPGAHMGAVHRIGH